MTRYEYKVIPAPTKGEKARGVRSASERFALALSGVMNTMGRDGWEYVRAESLPAEERSGWTRRATVVQHILVFRRSMGDDTVRVGSSTVPVQDNPARPPVANAEGVSKPIGPAARGA
ncbi:DUF4177 domain-containing protein [Falsirhodobacter sp. alg1]|uniref:DUF4177 domain-containing protein n=1 Tax=Falsirhodobacter sp. alg1 TaxID=1472418 RepID=UPI0007869F3D|nr:DUF4177 domain-containing protein [Falsirhodobacter sp. alg1]